MDKLTVRTLKYELQKRQLDSRGVKAVLMQRLRDVLVQEGHDPDAYISDFEIALSGPVEGAAASHGQHDARKMLDVGPEDSASQVSRDGGSRSALSRASGTSRQSRSSVRSSASLRLEEATKRADLLARASMGKVKRDMEEQELQKMMEMKRMELEMRQRREDLELQTEIAASEARARAIEEEEDRIMGKENQVQYSASRPLRAEAEDFLPRQLGAVPDPSSKAVRPMLPLHADGPAPVLLRGSCADLNRPQCYPAIQTGHSEHGSIVQRPVPLTSADLRGNNDGDHREEANDRQACSCIPGAGSDERRRAASERTPIPDPSAAEQTDFVKALLVQQARSKLPKLEVPKFTGCVTDFIPFISAFDSLVGSRVDDEEEKLRYLEQHTDGEPRDIVKGCLMMPAADGYAQARARLQRRYGDKRRMAAALVDKLLSWPPVRNDDIRGLDKLSIFLDSCSSSMPSQTVSVNELDHPGLLRSVMEKLPVHIQDRWRRTAVNIQDSGRCVVFDDLARFVESEVRVVSDPLFGKQVVNQSTMKSFNQTKADGKPHNKSSCLATNVAYNPREYACWHCDGKHLLEDCSILQKQDSDEKRKIVMQHSLCFGCLSKGHRVAECKRRKSCKLCKGRHPTVMHDDRVPQKQMSAQIKSPDSEKSESSGAVDVVAGASQAHGGAGMSIIPVRVRVGGGRAVSTYAFLDNGSSATFCTESLLRELQVYDTESAQLSLCTVDPELTKVDSQIVSGFQVSDLSETEFISLPPVYTLPRIPVTHDDIPKQHDLQAWPHLQDVHLPDLDADIGLMIGNNAPEAVEPWQILHGQPGEPFAVETKLGWVVNGPVKPNKETTIKVNRVGFSDDLHQMFVIMYDEEVKDSSTMDEKGMSRDDHVWMDRVTASCSRLESGHYQIALPFRDDNPHLPNNRLMAERRLAGLKRKLATDGKFHQDYTASMTDMIEKGYAEPVPEEERKSDDGKTWYIPHHGVRHPQKPEKLRVVFDCAATFHGVSLNSALLQGPDLTNNLEDVLIRLREESIAFMADIEAMFLQVGVPPEDRDFLRFLWWPGGDLSVPPKKYRMTVHLFGASSSPSCANFALRKTADDFGQQFCEKAGQTVKNNFYVDDCLRSEDSEEVAIQLVDDLKRLCSLGGFKLTKFVSTSRGLMKTLPKEDHGKDVTSINLDFDTLPQTRALGVHWDMDSDTFSFTASLMDRPVTKRGILSTVSSVYDPIGIAAPFILCGRLVLQNLCRLRLDWDDDIPNEQKKIWQNWLGEFHILSQLQVNRCFKPPGFGKTVFCQLHHFSDASESAYGVVSFLRMVNEDGQVHCCFVYGKAKVAPLKAVTIPRLELMGAVAAVRINRKLQKALSMSVDETVFWTDSTTVLGYIENRTTRFHRFVSNRLEMIHDGSSPLQWRYVSSEANPADDASRGRQTKRWLEGPAFLWKDTSEWPRRPEIRVVASDPELKQGECKAFAVTTVPETDADESRSCSEDVVHRLAAHYSSWYRLRKAVAWLLRLKTLLLHRVRHSGILNTVSSALTMDELSNAEGVIVGAAQQQTFPGEISALKSGDGHVKKSSSLSKLDPQLHNDVLRVGGRLDSALVGFDVKHPIILPRAGRVTQLLVEDAHRRVGHQGREHVLAKLREKFWIVKGSSAVREMLRRCLQCRRRCAPPMVQKMAPLPEQRTLSDSPPFTNTGVDCFGPFFTRRGRAQVKVYGIIFTCLVTRAVHLELADSLSADSFINALRRFIARRGRVQTIQSDRGTNFVGAERELKEILQQWNVNQIQEAMLQKDVQWIFNPPHASHHGGVWERQIRTVRKVLNALLHEQVLTNDGLRTLFCEVEAILNSRPLTSVSQDHTDLEPLTPNHFLLHRSGVPLPPGLFDEADGAGRRRWKQVQYLADLFWKRWRREYLPLLQTRTKWLRQSPNLSVGDIVILVDDSAPRCHWPLGRIVEVFVGSDGLVRSARVRTSSTVLERPVTKLVLISKEG